MATRSDSGTTPKEVKILDQSGEGDDSCKDYDAGTQKALEEIDTCQTVIEALNEKASREILKVVQKYNKLRKPFFEKRNQIINRISYFWVTAFVNHPQISAILDEEEEDCLHYLSKLEVEEFEDIKSGYRINFYFDENPYFENDVIKKEFHLGSSGDPASQRTTIRWKEGMNLTKETDKNKTGKALGKRFLKHNTFFGWFSDYGDPSADDIAKVIKDDVWLNPLQYYPVPDNDIENGLDEEADGIFDGNDKTELEEVEDDGYEPTGIAVGEGREGVPPLQEEEDADALDQQPGPVNADGPRPSETIPGQRLGSHIYADGNGYYYRTRRVVEDKRYLRCNNRQCRALAWMRVADRSPIIPSRNSPLHNCQPDPAGGQNKKFMSTVKKRAREERDVSIPTIFADEAIRHKDAAVRLSRSTVLRTMSRSRRAP
ncbi:protein SET isoform X2 [Nilaparvata lugens]|uniref:protein SET isoform X1 n=1 Tax=Nilaparvata lugens TaxID=108931 RepID=UPI00193D1409|nr:protein SET isoform X1 [Nilaparvata lugens]XP_039278383.1 protein SET isoform X2 [Nilaparvata lugens]